MKRPKEVRIFLLFLYNVDTDYFLTFNNFNICRLSERYPPRHSLTN